MERLISFHLGVRIENRAARLIARASLSNVPSFMNENQQIPWIALQSCVGGNQA